MPFKEGQREDPVSPYSASKVAATFFCQMFHKIFHLPIVTIRPFLTYGPGQVGDMLIPMVIEKALKNKTIEITAGEQTREFNYIDDIVDGYIRVASCSQAIGEIINLGNGVEYKIKEVVEMIVKMTGSSAQVKIGTLPYRLGESQHFYSVNDKARKLLGWKPRVSLEEGLKNTISWYKKYLRL